MVSLEHTHFSQATSQVYKHTHISQATSQVHKNTYISQATCRRYDGVGKKFYCKQNNWFKHAIKIAIDIECESNKFVLASFTGNSEAILDARDTATLKKMIHKVSVRASEFQSHSKQSADVVTSPEEDSANIVAEVIKDVDQDTTTPITSDSNDWGNWD